MHSRRAQRAIQWLAGEMGIQAAQCNSHLLDDAQCQRAIEIISRFVDPHRAAGRVAEGGTDE
jgi:hypothetical protein